MQWHIHIQAESKKTPILEIVFIPNLCQRKAVPYSSEKHERQATCCQRKICLPLKVCGHMRAPVAGPPTQQVLHVNSKLLRSSTICLMLLLRRLTRRCGLAEDFQIGRTVGLRRGRTCGSDSSNSVAGDLSRCAGLGGSMHQSSRCASKCWMYNC